MMRYSIVGQKFRGLDPYLPGAVAGSPAMLVRERDNPHDPFAVAVYVAGKHVGYLSKRENVAVAKVIDAKAFSFPSLCAEDGIACDAASDKIYAIRATFVRSPNTGYPQIEVEL
jgi:hypothetical protein